MKDRLETHLTVLGLGIVIGAAAIFFVTQMGLVPTGISVGPFEYEIPTSQPLTPGPAVTSEGPTSTTGPQGPTVQSLGTIRVFGNSNAGVQIQIPETGIYRFSYSSGAYAVYADGKAPPDTKPWLTAVFVYRGTQALWDGTRIEQPFLSLFDASYWASAEDANNAAQGKYVEAQLIQDTALTLIAVDHFDSYADNPGHVTIEWFLVKY